MRRIVAVATPQERKLIKRFLTDDDYEAVVITGVGGTNVVRTLRSYPQDTHIINIGFAGSATIPKGSVVKVKQVSLFHKACEYEEPVMKIAGEGVHCYTSCDFLGDKEARKQSVQEKREIVQRFAEIILMNDEGNTMPAHMIAEKANEVYNNIEDYL